MLVLSSVFASFLVITLSTYLFTTISYHISMASLSVANKESRPTRPPLLPYSLPFLGIALSFLSKTPGKFWRFLQHTLDAHPALSIVTLYMGGRKIHVLHSPKAVTSLFKARNVSRDIFNHDIMVKAMGLPPRDAEIIYPWRRDPSKKGAISDFEHLQFDIYNKYLLTTNAVNSLTSRFLDFYLHDLDTCPQHTSSEWHTIDLVSFLKRKMFAASALAIYGSNLYNRLPDFADRYWDYDTGFLPRFYSLPRLLFPAAYSSMDTLIDTIEQWVIDGQSHHNNTPPDPSTTAFDPHIGASLILARRHLYQSWSLSPRGMAALDLGFMYGLQSNAIPATTWLLCHLLSPSNHSLLKTITEECLTAYNPQTKTLDIPTLLTLPHLNSAVHETLRMYVDVLVTRELQSDTMIENHLLKKGEVVMVAQFLAHHDGPEWNDPRGVQPPEDVWSGERFLRVDEKTGRKVMSNKEYEGRFFPWGGGPQTCPGRVFAKQEVLTAVAGFLCGFEVEFVGFVRGKREGEMKVCGEFPVVKRQFSGNGVVAIEGDVRCRIRSRAWKG